MREHSDVESNDADDVWTRDEMIARLQGKAGVFVTGTPPIEGEPSVHPDLLALPNVVLTPHIASASLATRRAMAALAAERLICVLDAGVGRVPPTVVNREVLARRL